MLDAVNPGGLVLDLQVIRPDPTVETGGDVICEMDGLPLFVKADAAVAAVEAAIAEGRLVEEAVDDHDVLKHYASVRGARGRLGPERPASAHGSRPAAARNDAPVRDPGALPAPPQARVGARLPGFGGG